ncbi:MAG: M28 family peptidase [Deltaproteobacteria bacterium]|nr:M28 family peptidase [Deltaproteobacteria bacterium]
MGRVAGAQRPEQSVVVVAHWDAGGHAAAAGAGAGAEDNAAGVAIALAMADRAVQWTLAGRRPLRSIVFVLTADGSLGPYGVERYLAGGVADRKNVAAVIVLSGFDLHDSSAHLVAIGAERSSLDVTLTNAFDGGIARELAGTRFDNPEREALDAAGLVTLALTRRSEAGALIDGPFAASTNLKALASTTDSIFDLVWQLADEPGIPVRVEAADDDDKPSEGTAVLARPSDGIDQPP